MPTSFTEWRRPLMIIVALVLLALLAWWPVHRRSGELRRQISTMEQDLALADNKAGRLTQLNQRIERLTNRLGGESRQVPPYHQLPEVLRELSLQIDNEQLTNQGMSTLNARHDRDYIALPVEMSFAGDGLSAFRFVNRLESMRQLVQIDTLSLKLHEGREQANVQASLRLNLYFSPTGEGDHDD
jgi:Tfp pilus assembly protein PilO